MAFKMDAGRGNYAKTGKGIPMVLRQDPPVDPKTGEPKSVTEVANDFINKVGGNLVSGVKGAGQKIKQLHDRAFPAPRGGYRPIIKDGKINFDFSRMDNVMTGLDSDK